MQENPFIGRVSNPTGELTALMHTPIPASFPKNCTPSRDVNETRAFEPETETETADRSRDFNIPGCFDYRQDKTQMRKIATLALTTGEGPRDRG